MQRSDVPVGAGINIGFVSQQKARYQQLPGHRCLVQRCLALLTAGGVDQVRAVLDQRLDSLHLLFLLIRRCGKLAGFGGYRTLSSPGKEVLTAQVRQGALIAKLPQDALILGGGLIGSSQFPIAFAKAEDGGGGQLALFIGVLHDGLIGLDGRLQVMVGFLLEKAFLKSFVQAVRGGRELGQSQQQGRHQGEGSCFHISIPFISTKFNALTFWN